MPDLRRLEQLEEENLHLKQLVADLSLDKQMLQDVLKQPSEACAASPRGSTLMRRVSHLDTSGLLGRIAAALQLVLPTARAG